MKKIGIIIPLAMLLLGAGCNATTSSTQNTDDEKPTTQNQAQASVQILPATK